MTSTTTLSLSQALHIFDDNLTEIIDALSENLIVEMEEEKKSDVLGTSWVAEEVRTIRHDQLFGSRIKTIKRISFHIESKRKKIRNRITNEDIERAKEFPIQELYTDTLKKSGKNFVGLCPFHNDKKHPAFFIFTKNNRYKCFTCGEGGDSINFTMKYNNISFLQAVKQLCG